MSNHAPAMTLTLMEVPASGVGADVCARVIAVMVAVVGEEVGACVGSDVCACVGADVGARVGADIGARVGDVVVADVGDEVGECVQR